MATPTLLLRPGFSRNTAGTVTPGTTGTVAVVGDDWQLAAASTVTYTLTGEIASGAGTLAIWYQPGDTNWYGKSAFHDIIKAQASSNQLVLYRNNTADGRLAGRVATASVGWVHGKVANDTAWVFFTIEWNGTSASSYANGVLQSTQPAGAPSVGTTITLGSTDAMNVSAAMVFNAPLTTDERNQLAATQDWTWYTADAPVAPVVDAGADTGITTADTFARTVSFTDTPQSTSWTATVDYGEGAGPVAATVDQGAKTVALSNVYEAAGVYTVTVTVTDNGGLSDSDTLTVTVVEPPTIGQYVIADVTGTDASAPTITLA